VRTKIMTLERNPNIRCRKGRSETGDRGVTIDYSEEYLIGLMRRLCKLPNETEWVEFKHNKAGPEEIGEYLSALANTAALLGKINAYLVLGIDDENHEIVGTRFNPVTAKVGNEELESWLLRLLEPKIDFRFFEIDVDNKSVVLLEIGAAFRHPVQFKHQEFIRVGSYKKKLKDYPEKERALWRVFDQIPFERGIAAEHVSSEEVLKLLDYPPTLIFWSYLCRTGRPLFSMPLPRMS